MFGDEIILRGEAAYQSVKGTFPGNRGYLVGSSLAGKPYPPHGITVVWTGISWKPEGITPLDSTDDLQAYAGVDGAVASVNGVQYTYGAAGWSLNLDIATQPIAIDEWYPNSLMAITTGAPTSVTYAQRMASPSGKFGAVQLILPAGDDAVAKYAIAVSADPNDNGSALTWTVVTWSGASTVTRSASAFEIRSDIMPINSIQAPDGLHYLFVRCFGAAIKYALPPVSSAPDVALAIAEFGGYVPITGQVYDGTDYSTSGSVPLSAGATQRACCLGSIFFTKKKTLTIAQVGDSLDQGWNTAGSAECQVRPISRYAVNYLRSVGIDAGAMCIARQGRTHALAMGDIDSVIALGAPYPDIVVARGWSPNEAYSRATFAKVFASLSVKISKLKSLGICLIVQTSPPCGATGDAELARVEMNSKIRTLPYFADLDAEIAVAIGTNAQKVEYRDPLGNTTHLSQLGYQACGLVLGRAIAAIV